MTLVYTLRSASSRRQSLATGHLNVPCFIWTSTVRMRPSSPGNVLTTRPRFHLPRGILSSTTSTRSPIGASVWDLVLHFLRSVSAGTYSHNHLLQKWSVSVWACLHRFLEFKSLCHQWHREVRSGCSFQWGNSLHDRRFMSQAGRTWYFARSATRSWSARRGKRKIKGLFAVHCSCCSAHLRSKHDPLSHENCHLSGTKRLHCSRNEELRLFPWLRELLPKFMGLNHLILYVGQC